MDCHGKQFLVVAYEELREWRSKKLGCHSKEDSPDCDKGKALFKHIFKLIMIAGTIVVADNRGTSDGIAKENGYKNKLHIH